MCLGGPQGTISQGFSTRWNYRLMASKGYIVILPNRRGTTAFGQPWCEQISGDYIGLNMSDYLTAVDEMKKEPYVGKLLLQGQVMVDILCIIWLVFIKIDFLL
jgi:Dipeptidyl aminopeptidases/acylaminoacyl-peptidases